MLKDLKGQWTNSESIFHKKGMEWKTMQTFGGGLDKREAETSITIRGEEGGGDIIRQR